MSDFKFEKPFGFLLMFLFAFFSYRPIKEELVDLAGNATTTNAIIELMNTAGFTIIWVVIACLGLIGAIYYFTIQIT